MQKKVNFSGEGGGFGGGGLEKVCAQGRTESEGDEGRNGHGSREGEGEFPEEDARRARLKGNRKKDHDQAGGDGQNGSRDLFHGEQTGVKGLHALLDVANDVFQHHDGVIHHDADGEHEGEEGEDVDAVSEEIEKGEGAENRNGNRGGRNNRGPRVVQKEKDQHDNEKAGDPQCDHHLVNGVLHIEGGVKGDVDFDIGRQGGADDIQFSPDPFGDLDGIGVRLFDHAEADGRFPLEPGDGFLHFRANLDRRHVSETNGGIGRFPHNEICVLLGLVHPSSGEDAEGAFLALNSAGGQFDIFSLEEATDIGGGHLTGCHLG